MDPEIKNLHVKKLCGNWSRLKSVEFDYLNQNGEWEHHEREIYDRGNGAVILLYNTKNNTVILTRQLRIPTYLNGNETGMMIEACAGLLDDESAEHGIRRETEEETGYKIQNIQKVFEAYTSPGSVTEILHFFIAEYSQEMKVNEGGGAEGENENIEVLEMSFKKAVAMVEAGEIRDAKTIMLLQYLQIHKLVIL